MRSGGGWWLWFGIVVVGAQAESLCHGTAWGLEMSEQTKRGLAYDPQELERFLVARENEGDVEGMAALYEAEAVLDCGGGSVMRGRETIRRFYGEVVGTGRKFAMGEQRAAMVCGDLALTSTRLPDGDVTAEVARRQSDGSWLWVIDRFSIL